MTGSAWLAHLWAVAWRDGASERRHQKGVLSCSPRSYSPGSSPHRSVRPVAVAQPVGQHGEPEQSGLGDPERHEPVEHDSDAVADDAVTKLVLALTGPRSGALVRDQLLDVPEPVRQVLGRHHIREHEADSG
jgi:hypothetical protein